MNLQTNIKFSPVNIEERKKLDIRSGDTVRVWSKIEEKGKTRLQAYEGLVLARKHGTEPGATITVRKISKGVGVERIFPLYSPAIDKIEIIRRAKIRRSKLYYIREKTAKEIRKKMKSFAFLAPEPEPEPEPAAPEGDEPRQGREPEPAAPEGDEPRPDISGREPETREPEKAPTPESVGKEEEESAAAPATKAGKESSDPTSPEAMPEARDAQQKNEGTEKSQKEGE